MQSRDLRGDGFLDSKTIKMGEESSIAKDERGHQSAVRCGGFAIQDRGSFFHRLRVSRRGVIRERLMNMSVDCSAVGVLVEDGEVKNEADKRSEKDSVTRCGDGIKDDALRDDHNGRE